MIGSCDDAVCAHRQLIASNLELIVIAIRDECDSLWHRVQSSILMTRTALRLRVEIGRVADATAVTVLVVPVATIVLRVKSCLIGAFPHDCHERGCTLWCVCGDVRATVVNGAIGTCDCLNVAYIIRQYGGGIRAGVLFDRQCEGLHDGRAVVACEPCSDEDVVSSNR